MIEQLALAGCRATAIAIDHKHAHLLVALPDDPAAIRKIIGDAKRIASKSIRSQMPGRVWASGGKFEPVDDESHYANTRSYILHKQGPGAFAWGDAEGVVNDPAG